MKLDRKLDRLDVTDRNQLVKFDEGEGILLNYNSLGMLFSTKSELSENASLTNITIFLKNKIIGEIAAAKVIRVDQGRFFTAVFDNTKMRERQDIRYTISEAYQITFQCHHPFKYDYRIIFKIIDMSLKGMRLETSLSNRDLLVGTRLEKISVDFPLIGNCHVSGTIKHVSCVHGKLELGLRLDEEKTYQDHMVVYSLKFSDLDKTTGLNLIENHKPNQKLLLSTVEIRRAQEHEYNDIYEFRRSCYFPDDIDKKTKMADRYDQHSIHLIALMKGLIVGAVRLTLIRHEHDNFELSESIDVPEKFYKNKSIEISRLCILRNLRGSELMANLLGHCLIIADELNTTYVLSSSKSKLLPRYKKLGFTPGKVFILKTLDQSPHHFISLEMAQLKVAQNVNFFYWSKVYKKPLEYISQLSDLKLQLSWWRKSLIKLCEFILKIVKK